MATFTSVATGNWTTASTWDLASSYPQAGDSVIIANTHTITIDTAAQACTTLTINAGGTLTDATNNKGLTVSGATTVGGTLTCGNATMSFASGNTSAIGLNFNAATSVFTGGSGAHTIGSLAISNASASVTFTSGTTTFNGYQPSGDIINCSGGTTFTHNSGTVNITTAFSGTKTMNYSGTLTFYNLTLNSSGLTFGPYSNSTTVNNNLVITAGTFSTNNGGGAQSLVVTGTTSVTGTLSVSSSAATFTGTFTVNNGGTFSKTSGTGTLTFSGNVYPNSGSTFVFTGANGVINVQGSGKQFVYDTGATVTINGTSGNPIVYSSYYDFLASGGGGTGTLNLQYVQFNSPSADHGMQFNTTIPFTQVDNITTTKAGGASTFYALYCNGTGTLTPFTNCTFTKATGGYAIGIGTSIGVEMSNCTYSGIKGDVNNNGSTGWVSSITDNGTANNHVIVGVLNANTPTASYRLAAADNVSLNNYDAFGGSSFVTVLTFNVAASCKKIIYATGAKTVHNTGVVLSIAA